MWSKKCVNLVKKTCRFNVEKLTTVQKAFVHELRPLANVRELTRAQASMPRDLTHARVITGNHVGREQNVQGEEQDSSIISHVTGSLGEVVLFFMFGY